jgi:hypothetical protein
MDGYIEFDDLLKGRITEKVNRETIAAAKYAVLKELERRNKAPKTASTGTAKGKSADKGQQKQSQNKKSDNTSKGSEGKKGDKK